MKTWLAFALVVLVTAALAWPKASASSVAAQSNIPVQLVPAGQKQAGNPGEKGSTYYALEAQTTRVTTRFRDGHEAVSERGLTGDVTATVRDHGGNQQARLRLNRIDAGHDMVNIEPSDGSPTLQALSNPATVKPTLDWAARQAYGLAMDGVADLVWDGGAMRPRNAARRDVEKDVDQVETVWANGVVAKASRQNYSRRQIAPGRFVEGPVLVTELTQHGTPIGTGVWFERDRVFAYTLPGLLAGAVIIGEKELKANYGGWPFAPDTTWLNLQMIAAHHFKTLSVRQGSVAKACEPAKPSRVAQFFMPTVQANEPGCDGLHWLDGTIVRECCDDHDRCYAKGGCSSSSWWMVWSSWTCTSCNLAVVGCFLAESGSDQGCITGKERCAY